MLFETYSGSVYKIDTTNKKIQRVLGLNDPQPRQGKDGEWKRYEEIIPSTPTIGNPIIIIWDRSTPLFPNSPKYAIPNTMTSTVVKIIDQSQLNN